MVWEHFDYLIHECSPSICSGISCIEQENHIHFVMCNFVTTMVTSGINSSPVFIFNLKEFCISWLTWLSIKNHCFSEAASFWSAPWRYPVPLKVSDYQTGLFCLPHSCISFAALSVLLPPIRICIDASLCDPCKWSR